LDGKRQGVEMNASKRLLALPYVFCPIRRHLLTGILRMGFLTALRVPLLAGVLLAIPISLPGASFCNGSTALATESLNRSAIEAALRGDFVSAGSLAEASDDQAAVHLVEFLYLKDHWKDAGYNRIASFLKQAPKWPLSETFAKRAEHLLFADKHSADEILDYFTATSPLSADGHLALARAQFAKGDAERGRASLMKGWLSGTVDPADEKLARNEFSGYLSEQDLRKRVWALVLAQESNAAIRNAKRVGGGIVEATETAQLLLRFVSGADKKFAALPPAMREQAAMKYALARFYRKNEKFQKARGVLESLPGNAETMIDPEAIWTERRIIARRLLGLGQKDSYGSAYAIASKHGLTSGESAVEAQFLSGWIALRYLKDTKLALKHFEALADLAPTRTEKARAHYWLARALDAQGKGAAAQTEFKTAAQYATVFYGQLAREEVGLADVPQRIVSGAAPEDAKRRVEKDEVLRAFSMLKTAGGKAQINLFLWSLASRFENVDELNAVASVIHDAGGTPMALRFAKAAGKRGFDIDSWAYPLRGLPDWRQIGKPIEKSLVFALSRQESEFDTNAGSKAGAQGLMQLMPGTARLVAAQNRLPFAPQRLKSDPVYNVQLGSAHLSDLVAEYDGSYILTLVAYNAGPRRVREWVDAYGDPRSGKVDPIDWVESIPFQETRQYVQKVMQNVHIYRSRLAPKSVRPMSADLRRGGPSKITELLTGSVEPAGCMAGMTQKACE
jgi:soluble lytic murein transglycosylase